MRKYLTDHTERHFSINFWLTKIKLLGFYGCDLKDVNDGQGVFCQFTQGYANFLEQRKLFYKRKDFDPTRHLFNFFSTPKCPPWRHMKTLYGLNIAHFLLTVRNRLKIKSTNERNLWFRHRSMYEVTSTFSFAVVLFLCFKIIFQCSCYRSTPHIQSLGCPNPHIQWILLCHSTVEVKT